jgi:hypothetical protein
MFLLLQQHLLQNALPMLSIPFSFGNISRYTSSLTHCIHIRYHVDTAGAGIHETGTDMDANFVAFRVLSTSQGSERTLSREADLKLNLMIADGRFASPRCGLEIIGKMSMLNIRRLWIHVRPGQTETMIGLGS